MARFLSQRIGLLLLAAFMVILAAIGAAAWDRFDRLHDARDWVRHTYRVLDAIKDLDDAVDSATAGERAFLLTGDDGQLAQYRAGRDRVTLSFGGLQHLTADNPAQQERLARLGPLVQRVLETLAQEIELRRSAGFDAALARFRATAALPRDTAIDQLLAAMGRDEDRLLTERLAASDRAETVTRWASIAGAALAMLMLGIGTRLLVAAAARHLRMLRQQETLATRLRTSLDSLSQGVGVFGPDRALVDWNHCFQELLHLPSTLLRAGTPYDAFVERTAEAGFVLLETAQQVRFRRAGGPDNEPIIYDRVRPSDQHTLEIRRTPMEDGGFVLTVSDMTSRARADAVLRQSQKMEAIGHLTGGIAHDFNNLLTVILGNLEFVRARLGDNEALAPRLERAVWATRRGATLTSQLLSFARKQPLAPQPLDMSRAVTNLLPLLQRTLPETIELRAVDAAGLWPALADEAQLEAAVLNLALNARDAMSEGGRLTIELANKVLDEDYAAAHAEVAAGDYVMLAVSDTGHGMPREVAARAFEPFFTTKPVGKGTGLGLAMVFGFVKQSGGHVKIYSEPGEGTTVRVYLPRAIGIDAGMLAGMATPALAPRGSATVLLVEDEAQVREITATTLRDLGYRVLEAVDGEQAMRAFGASDTPVDLALLDVILPGRLRGRDVAERLQAIRPAMRVLYMSGYTENAIVHQGRLDDGVHLIGKPFDRERLARKVAQVLATPAPEAN